jgi:hypothetical protein
MECPEVDLLMCKQIIRDVTSNLDNIALLPAEIKDLVSTIFVQSLTNVWRMKIPPARHMAWLMLPSLLACVRLPSVSSNFSDARRRIGGRKIDRATAWDISQCPKNKRLAEVSLVEGKQAVSVMAGLGCIHVGPFRSR